MCICATVCGTISGYTYHIPLLSASGSWRWRVMPMEAGGDVPWSTITITPLPVSSGGEMLGQTVTKYSSASWSWRWDVRANRGCFHRCYPLLLSLWQYLLLHLQDFSLHLLQSPRSLNWFFEGWFGVRWSILRHWTLYKNRSLRRCCLLFQPDLFCLCLIEWLRFRFRMCASQELCRASIQFYK